MLLRKYSKFERIIKVITGVGVITLLLFNYRQPAHAKGPTSVTISGPGIEDPIELIDTDNLDLITLLMEQSGIWYGVGDLPSPVSEPAGELGQVYELTWVNGGPPGTPIKERTIVQFIYLNAESGALIHTPPQDSLQNWGQSVIGWFAAPEGLPDTLMDLGVPISTTSMQAETSHVGRDNLPGQLAAVVARNSWVAGASIFAFTAIFLLASQQFLRRSHKR